MNDKSIQKYITLIEKIKASKFLKDPNQLILLISPSGDQINPTKHFDEDSFRSYLIDVRKIISLKGAETYFFNVCSYIHKNTKNPDIKSAIAAFRKLFSDTLNDSSMDYLVANGIKEKPLHNLDRWMNGYYFHEDQEKNKTLNDIQSVIPDYKFLFVATVTSLFQLSMAVQEFAKVYLREKQSD